MKDTVIAVRYRGDGDGAFVPLNPTKAAKTYKDGEIIYFRPDKERHWPEHQAFMALMNEAWHSLTDEQQEEFIDVDTLRRRLLIAAGFRDIKSIVFESAEDAKTYAVSIAQFMDNHTFISIKDNVIVLMKAHSQAMDKMDEITFRQSCDGVKVELAKLLGCSVEELKAYVSSVAYKNRQRVSP